MPVEAPVAGASNVDMLVATTRAPDDDGPNFFSGERGSTLSLANVNVSIPPGHQPTFPK